MERYPFILKIDERYKIELAMDNLFCVDSNHSFCFFSHYLYHRNS